ncbi:hypothetical protein Spock_228 [Bacillus phage Spock]|uniref:Uncharacterized protein n=1 Tax=Bacillus phage Spock TaxID=1406791 RepID=U5Q151_9CAUD|nr:hypothetical protein Spock_228 [Bacillus phage Spock]AGY48628.1 hypothetical protein Spock_228 [Bacillus phage Spock]
MKRYLIFGFDNYYPCGGFYDLVAVTDDLTKGIEYIKEHHEDLFEGYGSGRFDNFYVFDNVENQWYVSRVELSTETVYLEEQELDYKVL